MKVRLIFCCPRCNSMMFRASHSRHWRDSLVRPFGIHPHRCYLCRLRFYLFKPARLQAFLELIDHPVLGMPSPKTTSAETARRAIAARAGD